MTLAIDPGAKTPVDGYLSGIAYHRDGIPWLRRRRVQASFAHLFDALAVPEEFRDRTFAILRPTHNLIVTAGKNFLVDAWQNLVEMEIMKFHGVGLGTTAATTADTALGTECTTQLSGDARASGTTVEGASGNIFRTVGTNAFDVTGPTNISEWGLFTLVTPNSGVMFSRVVFAAIPMGNGDSVQWTYEVTVG